jgi:hypothetical protein
MAMHYDSLMTCCAVVLALMMKANSVAMMSFCKALAGLLLMLLSCESLVVVGLSTSMYYKLMEDSSCSNKWSDYSWYYFQ